MKQETLNPYRLIALGAIAVFIFSTCLLIPSCEHPGDRIIAPTGVAQGITQETLSVFNPIVDVFDGITQETLSVFEPVIK